MIPLIFFRLIVLSWGDKAKKVGRTKIDCLFTGAAVHLGRNEGLEGVPVLTTDREWRKIKANELRLEHVR